jgi:hypothetical protein
MGYCNRGHLAAPALAALLAALSAGPARAQEPAAVTIILDASGSMWNNIEGSKGSKINLAREAVRRALPKLPPQTKVGLAAFGHRRGDCVDVELIRAPEPIDAPRMSEQMEKVNPRGRGPLVHALREAAKPLLPLPGRVAPRGPRHACGGPRPEARRHGQDGLPAAGDRRTAG